MANRIFLRLSFCSIHTLCPEENPYAHRLMYLFDLKDFVTVYSWKSSPSNGVGVLQNGFQIVEAMVGLLLDCLLPLDILLPALWENLDSWDGEVLS